MRLRWIAAVLCTAALAAAEPAPTPGIPPLPSVIQWHATPSGMQYADVAIGRGPNPREGQVVVVHFTGWLDDGTQFDSTQARKKPFGFPVGSGQVIKGWDEGVRTMQVGGKRRLVVPPQLAYGAKGVPGLVPPNSRLTFDIELLRIIDQPTRR